MRVYFDDQPREDERATSVTMGVFDGVHLGHQTIIGRALVFAREHALATCVVTFDPHPAVVLAPSRAPLAIETLEQRLERFDYLGVDEVRVVSFTKEASLEEAESFVQRILIRRLNAHHVVVGEDFRFGHDRMGDTRRLATWGESYGFSLESVPLVGEGERYSSTAVRAALVAGDLEAARAILGHAVVLRGSVEHGDGRGGSELGYPTANLTLSPRQAVVATGIYAGELRVAGKWRPAAVSVGQRPQFYENGELLVEAHILDFDGTIYGETVDLVFLARLRGEEVFSSTDALIEQMGRDVSQTAVVAADFPVEDGLLLEFLFGQRR